MYTCMQRERERCVYTYMCIYTYMFIIIVRPVDDGFISPPGFPYRKFAKPPFAYGGGGQIGRGGAMPLFLLGRAPAQKEPRSPCKGPKP